MVGAPQPIYTLPKNSEVLSCDYLKRYDDAVPPPRGAKAVPAVSVSGTLPVQRTFRQTTRMLLGAHVLC